jgi:hypothetical protein
MSSRLRENEKMNRNNNYKQKKKTNPTVIDGTP